MKKCPYCAEDVKDEAKICPHCRKDVTLSGTLNRLGCNLIVIGLLLPFVIFAFIFLFKGCR